MLGISTTNEKFIKEKERKPWRDHTKPMIKLQRTHNRKKPIMKKNHDFLHENHFIL